MRTLVDIPEQQLAALAAMGAARKESRAELIRLAIAAFIATHKGDTDQAFGLWGKRQIDGLAYQQQARSEW